MTFGSDGWDDGPPATDVPVPPSPLAGFGDIEAQLASNAVRRAVYVGPPLIALFWVVGGIAGAVAAAIGLGIVVAYFLASGWMLSLAARRSLGLYHGAALFGFFIRLGLITITMLAITRLFDIDRVAMGITAIVSYLALLVWETISVTRGGERELEWTD